MRKDAKAKATTAEVRTIDRYHASDDYSINYAFQGFGENRFYTSDRYIKLDAHFNRADGKPLKGYGLEIETECNAINDRNVLTEVFNSLIASKFPEHLFKYQTDGSLGGNSSVEAITQVMSKEFIRNHYAEFKMMFNTYFPALGISASRSGNCGMHVNISNACFGSTEATQTEALKKMYYIINKHYTAFCHAFGRNPNRTMYCSRMEYRNAKEMNLYNMPSSHGNCLNYSHFPEGRVEIRLVGGQADFGAFRNTMEVVFHLVERVKTISWKDCDSLVKIFENCNYYVWDRLQSKVYRNGCLTDTELEAIKATADRTKKYI